MTQATQGKKKVILDQLLHIHYPVQFCKDKETIWALINFDSEVNAIIPAYAKKLGFRTWKIDVETQKIDESSLNRFRMVINNFHVIDKLDRARFF